MPPPVVSAAPIGETAGTIDMRARPSDSIARAPGTTPNYNAPIDAQPSSDVIVLDPFRTDPPVYWAITYGSGIWKSSDGGESWMPKNRGLVNLMIDALRPDPTQQDRWFAVQAPVGGSGAGRVYVSNDNGENWAPAGVCGSPMSAVMPVTAFDVGTESPVPSLLMTQLGSNSDCGLLFRSTDLGASWCSYSALVGTVAECDRPWLTSRCPGWNFAPGNDGAHVRFIPHDPGDPSSTDEVYFAHGKNENVQRCLGLFRSPVPSVSWQLRDRWDDPTPVQLPCGGIKNILKSGTLDFDPTDGNHKYRFAEHKIWKDARNEPDVYGIYGFHIGYSDGTLNLGDLSWTSAVDLRECLNLPVLNPTPPPNETGPLYPFVKYIRVATAGGKKRVFTTFDTSDPRVYLCDGDTDITQCSQQSNWGCIWDFSALGLVSNCGPALSCTARPHDYGSGAYWDSPLVSPLLSANGSNEVLFTARRLFAGQQFLKLTNDGTDWSEEWLKDPISCQPSGPGLLTPLQVFDVDPASAPQPHRLLMTSPRHVLESIDGGDSWQALQSDAFDVPENLPFPIIATHLHAFFDVGPIIAQAPGNPALLYTQDTSGMFRTSDGGTTFRRMYWEERSRVAADCKDGEALSKCPLVPANIAPGCGHGGICGRYQVSCPGITQMAVDIADTDTIYAATEKGLWTWTYPFTGVGCFPAISEDCLTFSAKALAGEQWRVLQGGCPIGSECMDDRYLLSVAQHLTIATRMFAGSKTGLYRSNNGGLFWVWDSGIPHDATVYKILPVAAPRQELVYVATDKGIFRSVDSGATFLPTEIVLPARDVSVFVPAAGPVVVYVAVMDYDENTFDEGVYRSTNEGLDGFWTKVVATADNQKVMSVFANPSNGQAFAGLLGDGLARIEETLPAPPCRRVKLAGTATPTVVPGAELLGTALTGLGDVLDAFGKGFCQSRIGVLEFDPGPTAAIRILADDGGNYRPRIASPRPLFGRDGSLQGVGDIDTDGCPDVALGLPRPLPSGSPGVVEVWSICSSSVTPAFVLPSTRQYFGRAMARSGNLLAVGAPSDLNPSVVLYKLDALPSPFLSVPAPAAAKRFGWSLAWGDLDGNGTLDLVVGSPDVDANGVVTPGATGNAFIYSSVDAWIAPLPPARTLAGVPNSAFGFSVTAGYDRKGDLLVVAPDGNADFAIGAPAETGTGKVYWYGHMFDAGPLQPVGQAVGDAFGWSVLLAKDVVGDVLDVLPDLLVGAPNYTVPPGTQQGAVYVFENSTTPSCFDELFGTVDFGRYGAALAEVGDIDKNRTPDIAIGQPDPAGTSGGRAFLHSVLR